MRMEMIMEKRVMVEVMVVIEKWWWSGDFGERGRSGGGF